MRIGAKFFQPIRVIAILPAVLFLATLTTGTDARGIRDFAPFVYDTDQPEILRLQGEIGAETPISLLQALLRFVARTSFTQADLILVGDQQICIEQ